MQSSGLLASLLQTLSASTVLAAAGFAYKWHSDVVAERVRHRDDVKRWSDAAIALLSRAGSLYVGVSTEAGDAEKARLQADLSAQIDVGRTYFPNKLHGEIKFGFRRRIYDWLVCAHRILKVQKGELSPEAKEHLSILRRQFITDRQEALQAIERLGAVTSRNLDHYEQCGFMDWNMAHKVLVEAESFIETCSIQVGSTPVQVEPVGL